LINSNRPPLLYLVTDRTATGGRPLARVVEAALRGIAGTGVDPADVAVQLREKDLYARELTDLARALRTSTRAAGVAFFVNDRIDVALAVGADGVHLGGGALAAGEAGRIAPGLALAVSTHGAHDIAAARAAPGGERIGFAVFGPVRDTPSKQRYGPPLGDAALAEAAKQGLPLVAIGGLGPADAPAMLRAGARGIACIRAVMSAPDPALAVAGFCKRLAAAAQADA
jgi:thiamine-phosphate pyrophosphorylase